MSRQKYCQECSCWMPYPNENRARKSKCRCDNYINISQVLHPYKSKTHCIRKDVIFGFTKEGKDNDVSKRLQ